MPAKKSVMNAINWPTAVIILGVIGTLAGLFGPMIGKDNAPVEVITSNGHSLSMAKALDEFKQHTYKQLEDIRKEQRDDMKFIRKELSSIKEATLENALDTAKARIQCIRCKKR